MVGRSGKIVALGLAGLLGCSMGQTRLNDVFSERSTGAKPGAMARLEVKLRASPSPPEVAVVVGVTDDGVVGMPLVDGDPWEYRHALSSRPEVVSEVVVGAGGGELFCLRAATGERLWARPIGGLEMIGAGDDGEVTVVTLSSPSGQSNTVLAVERDGSVLRQLETSKRLGRPGVLRGMAFVPWMERHVTAYNLLSGEEVARFTSRHGLSSVLLDDGSLFFGDQTLMRFDEQLSLLPADELPRLELPELAPFGALRVLPRLADARAVLAGQPDRVRAYARPTSRGSPLGLRGGVFYTAQNREVEAYRAGHERPRWSRILPEPTLCGAPYDGGLAVCGPSGRVLLLDEKKGTSVVTLALGKPLRSCVMQVASLRVNGPR